MIVTESDKYEMILSDAVEQHYCERSLVDSLSDSALDLTAFVSCYNEADYIVQTLDDIRWAMHELELSFEIIVVDDCSTDDSVQIVRAYIDAHPEERIILRRNRANKGLAQNYIDGAFLGKGKYYKLFCGDNSEPRESIVEICRRLGDADMILTSYSNVEGKSAFRKWLSNSYTALVNLLSGYRISYYNGLAVHLRHNIIRWHPNTRGFGFQADIICLLLDQGATYREISVPAVNRSTSRALGLMNFLSVAHTLTDLLIRRLANWMYRT